MKPDEITALREQHPDLFRRALALEDNARKNGFTNVRHFTDDGVRGTTFVEVR